MESTAIQLASASCHSEAYFSRCHYMLFVNIFGNAAARMQHHIYLQIMSIIRKPL